MMMKCVHTFKKTNSHIVLQLVRATSNLSTLLKDRSQTVELTVQSQPDWLASRRSLSFSPAVGFGALDSQGLAPFGALASQ